MASRFKSLINLYLIGWQEYYRWSSILLVAVSLEVREGHGFDLRHRPPGWKRRRVLRVRIGVTVRWPLNHSQVSDWSSSCSGSRRSCTGWGRGEVRFELVQQSHRTKNVHARPAGWVRSSETSAKKRGRSLMTNLLKQATDWKKKRRSRLKKLIISAEIKEAAVFFKIRRFLYITIYFFISHSFVRSFLLEFCRDTCFRCCIF